MVVAVVAAVMETMALDIVQVMAPWSDQVSLWVRQRAMAMRRAMVTSTGISINTSKLPAADRSAYLAGIRAETGLPCVDPIIDGCGEIADHIKQLYTE